MLFAPAKFARLFVVANVTAALVSLLAPVRSRLLLSIAEELKSMVPEDNAFRLFTTTIAEVIPVLAV